MGQFFGVPGPSQDDFETLNSKITTKGEATITTSDSSKYEVQTYSRCGYTHETVSLSLHINVLSNQVGWVTVATIPIDYKALRPILFTMVSIGTEKTIVGLISNNEIQLLNPKQTDYYGGVTFSRDTL